MLMRRARPERKTTTKVNKMVNLKKKNVELEVTNWMMEELEELEYVERLAIQKLMDGFKKVKVKIEGTLTWVEED